ncbi:hypothetical protein [Kamptonema formosum]|nr:hypothetical protein [Oscillatoria sp. PCC 10802]
MAQQAALQEEARVIFLTKGDTAVAAILAVATPKLIVASVS